MLRLMSYKLENKNQKHLVRSKFKQKHKHVKELHQDLAQPQLPGPLLTTEVKWNSSLID